MVYTCNESSLTVFLVLIFCWLLITALTYAWSAIMTNLSLRGLGIRLHERTNVQMYK